MTGVCFLCVAGMRRPTPGLAAIFVVTDRTGGNANALAAAWCSGGKPTSLKNAQRAYRTYLAQKEPAASSTSWLVTSDMAASAQMQPAQLGIQS